MQETITALSTHVLVVILFLVLFVSKALLLYLNKHEVLDKARQYTKALDAIFGTLILVSGFYLLYLYNGFPYWLIVKVALIFAAIPLGIVGLKRHSKLMTSAALLIFLYVYGVAETKSLTMSSHTLKENKTSEYLKKDDLSKNPEKDLLTSLNEAQLANAKAIYLKACAPCHTTKDNKPVDSVNLSISNLSLNERINVIEQGRGLMPGFTNQLTEQEIEALAAYTMTFKK
jgi:mono/diheme cytochrome c family protein